MATKYPSSGIPTDVPVSAPEESPEGLAGATVIPHLEAGDPHLRRQVLRRRDILRYGPGAFIRHTWVQLSILITMFASCAVVFIYYQKLDPLTALLASVSTITTIGIWAPAQGLAGIPHSEQVLLIVIFLVSVGAAASLVQSVMSQIVNKTLWTEEVLRREVTKMKGHVILMGYSYLGKYVAQRLDSLQVPYVVIIRMNADLQKLRSEGVPAFQSSPTEFHQVLEEVGVRHASTLICTFEEDPDNLMAILYANKVRPELRIITVVHDRDLESSARMAGADVIIPTANILGDLLGLAAVSKEVAGVVLSAKIPGRYLTEFVIPKGKSFRFGDLNAVAPVLLVLQDGKTLSNPDDEFRVESGSTIFVLTTPEAILHLRKKLGTSTDAKAED